MEVWLVKVGEPVPTDGKEVRLYRTGILATMLADKGHDVTWWTSTVDHVQKKHRFSANKTVQMSGSFKIKFLHSILYKRNVSIFRVINHRGEANAFLNTTKKLTPPDIIVCCFPTLELSLAAVRYGQAHTVPVILDIRDLWPDVFLDLVPCWMRSAAACFLKPMFKMVKEACSNATAIAGITSEFVDWGVNHAGRERINLDKCFPLAYREMIPDAELISEAEKKWANFGFKKSNDEIIICFFGNFGRQFEIETVIEAARILKNRNRKIKFVLCGSGDAFKHYRDLAKDCGNVIFPGWINSVEIYTLMRLSSIGIAPYRSSKSFIISTPNKVIEYMSAGLPVISSLKGKLKKILSEYNCGITYENENADELVSILIRLYNDPQMLDVMSNNSYALYKKSYSAEIVYGNMIEYLKEVIEHFNFKQKTMR